MAILKDLLISGVSRFIGKVFINDSHITTINNVTVTQNPKFTDTIALESMTGTLGIDHGGTGATSAAAARTNLGLGTASTYTATTSVNNNDNLPTGAAIQTYVTSLGYQTDRAPKNHASITTTYGIGTSNNYGHVKLSDSIVETTAALSGGTAATPKAVSQAKNAAINHIIASKTQPTSQTEGDIWLVIKQM